MDLAGLKNELFLIEQQLVNMRVKSHVMHEQLEMLETQSTHLEGVTLYLRGKLRDPGEDIGNDSKTLPDLNKL